MSRNKYIHSISQDKMNMVCIKPIGNIDPSILFFDATPRLDDDRGVGILKHITFELVNPEDTFTNILYLNDGVFVFSKKLFNTNFRWAISYVGELLEINIKNATQKYYLGSITHCMNIVDYEESKFSPKDQNGEREIIELHIKQERMSTGRSLFKLPDNASNTIYCLTNFCGLDFYKICKKNNYDFINFEVLHEYTENEVLIKNYTIQESPLSYTPPQ
jgi:hypothetical protein